MFKSNVDDPAKKRRDPAKERQYDHTRTKRSAGRYARWNEAARAAGFGGWSELLTQLAKDPALQDLIRNRKI